MSSKLIESRLPCPLCPSSDAYHLYDDGHGYCYSCKQTTFNGVLTQQTYTYEYIPLRGILKSTLEFYGVKTKVDQQGEPVAIGFRYPNGATKARLVGAKEFYTERGPNGEEIGKAGLFGRDKFNEGSGKYVTITEGELDALSYYQVLKSPVVSVQSATSAGRDCTVDRAWLNSFERIYLAFDNDEPGRRAVEECARLFDPNKIFVVRYTSRKDANEFLQVGETETLLNVWLNAKRYVPQNIKSYLSEFREILTKPKKIGVPYPFKTLTDMTYGIRTGETVLITAQEKVGKTEVMHFIEHKLLKETDHAIGSFFLEEPKQRHLQALAGIELGRPVHLPDCDVSSDQVVAALEDVVVSDERLHIYDYFGSDDPDVLLDTIRFLVSARSCKYILFDHISMVVSGRSELDERRTLDYLSTRLEMMVKELDFALILVSHVNDEGKTRGSRYLTKVADITINAARDLLNPDPMERNRIKFSIPYNRFCGQTGDAGSAIFDMSTYSFKEVGDGEETFLRVA